MASDLLDVQGLTANSLALQSDVQLIKTGDKVGASEATLLNMLNMIRASGRSSSVRGLLLSPSTLIFTLILFAGVALVIVEIIRKIWKKK